MRRAKFLPSKSYKTLRNSENSCEPSADTGAGRWCERSVDDGLIALRRVSPWLRRKLWTPKTLT